MESNRLNFTLLDHNFLFYSLMRVILFFLPYFSSHGRQRRLLPQVYIAYLWIHLNKNRKCMELRYVFCFPCHFFGCFPLVIFLSWLFLLEKNAVTSRNVTAKFSHRSFFFLLCDLIRLPSTRSYACALKIFSTICGSNSKSMSHPLLTFPMLHICHTVAILLTGWVMSVSNADFTTQLFMLAFYSSIRFLDADKFPEANGSF